LTRQQRNRDILRGFPVLILLILGIFFIKSTAVESDFSNAVVRDGNVFVQIEGEVSHPGVYSFDHEPSVFEAIEKGGISSGINNIPADSLSSGAKVTVHAEKGVYECICGEMPSFNKITLGIPVSINRESEEGLVAVPGIGRQLAAVIVKERDRRGGFKSLEELKTVSGIGQKKYKTILEYVTL
jgi:competence protein ComEA